MHIVLANQWYPPESGWGGVAMWNYAIARAFRARGHQVTVIASRLSQQIPAVHETEGICVRRLLVNDAYRRRRLPVVGRYVRGLQLLNYSRRVNQALRELYREKPFEIVEFADVNAEGFFYARSPLTPLVVRCHTPTFVLERYYTAEEMPYDTTITSWCERDLIRRASALTAPSQNMAETIARACNLPLERISVVPNAIALDEYAIADAPVIQSSNAITILYVGRLERVKGVEVLAQAIPRVIEKIPRARFVFIGEDLRTARGPSQRAELEDYLQRQDASSHVEFPGGVEEAALRQWYQRADICVVPSLLYESFSYTCAQAMVWGKPVVATRIGGIPETVEEGVSGLIVEPGNVEQLAEAVVRLAQEGGLRAAMGKAGREKAVREFDVVKVAEQTLSAYHRALEFTPG